METIATITCFHKKSHFLNNQATSWYQILHKCLLLVNLSKLSQILDIFEEFWLPWQPTYNHKKVFYEKTTGPISIKFSQGYTFENYILFKQQQK